MSNTKREPLLSDEEIAKMSGDLMVAQSVSSYEFGKVIGMNRGAVAVRGTYEAARAKDAELIQMLVDELRLLRIEFGNRMGQTTEIGIASLSDAEDAGFKPTDQ